MNRTPHGLADPELSVIMVSYGAWQLTERAVAALSANTGRTFELIVVDNGSDDATRAGLEGLAGARVILNDDNRGFGAANNQAASIARGKHLVLLNTDAFVHPDWIEPLLETLGHPRVGAVVPRLLHVDGSLQDAGTLMARDGSVRVYGDGDDPERPCYGFRRIIGLGSAACMVIRADVFENLGGFDERFSPAYYEDCDLCMRINQADLKVVYEPRSAVTHVRYGSGHGEGAAALSRRNRGLFLERWGPELAGRPATFEAPSAQSEILARDVDAGPRVLICASPDHPGAARLVDLLLVGLPSARVTWASGAPARSPGARNPWLECVDATDPAWLSDRLFFYDVAVLGDHLQESLALALEQTQPQATRLHAGELDDASTNRLFELLAAAGVAAPAT